MLITKSEIPQADRLEDVIRTAEAVKNGLTTYQQIASYIGKVGRQGRYYRLAAEILGLVEKAGRNNSRLTAWGKVYFESSSAEQKRLLASAVANTKLFQRMIPFFELFPNGVSRDQIEAFLREVTDSSDSSIAERRVTTVVNWLSAVGLLIEDNSTYKLSSKIASQVGFLEFQDIAEPIMPKSAALREYQELAERVKRASDEIIVMRDIAKSERALNAHIQLVNLVAKRLREAGSLPKANPLIDLASEVNNSQYIFEMKSVTNENERSQIRNGLSQLYEYQYLQNLPNAKLVLVIEKPLTSKVAWMQDYLESSRQIMLLWNGNNRLHASPKTQAELNFLW